MSKSGINKNIVSYSFDYIKKDKDVDYTIYDWDNYDSDDFEWETFTSNKKTLIEAMQDFLSSVEEIIDIDEEVEIIYDDLTTEFKHLNIHQDWDNSFYFIVDNQMISHNDIEPYNGAKQ